MKKIIALTLSILCLLCIFSGCSEGETLKWADGSITDGVYTNEALDMSFQIPEGWADTAADAAASASDIPAEDGSYSLLYDVDLRSPENSGRMFVARCDLSLTRDGHKLKDAEIVTVVGELLREKYGAEFVSPATEITGLFGISYVTYTVKTENGPGMYLVHRLSQAELVIVAVFGKTSQYMQYYFNHFTDDAASLPNPPISQPVEGNGEFARGVIAGGVYTSEYLGLQFTPPEKWIYALDEELAELMGASFDIIGDDVYGDQTEIAKEFAKQTVIYDMVSAAPDGSNVQIMLENLEKIEGGISLTAEDYAQIVCTQLQAITDYTYELSEVYTDYLAGTLYTVLDATVQESGMQQQFWLLRVDDYMLCITMTNMDGDASDFTDCFSEIA